MWPYTRAFWYSPWSTTVALKGSPTLESTLVRVSSKRIRSATSFGTTKLELEASNGEAATMSTAKRKKAITNDGSSGVFLRGFFTEVLHSKDLDRRGALVFGGRAAAACLSRPLG